MLLLILQAFVWFFVCFGIIQMVKLIINAYKRSVINENYLIVVKVINKEDSIEGILRSIVWDHLKQGSCPPPILVVDMGSTDDTVAILKRLASEYNFIHITDKDGYQDYFQGDK